MRSLNLGLQRPKNCGSSSRDIAAGAYKLQFGVTSIPHPDKVDRGGEDAYFFCDTALGVADGVGGWAESGVNPAAYAQGLMDVARAYYVDERAGEDDMDDEDGVDDGEGLQEELVVDDSGASYSTEGQMPAQQSSMEALVRAHAETQKPGSSTACIVQIDLESGAFDSSNLGDSGFVVIRDGQVVMQSEAQEHFFDCPYQLASLRFVPETDQATDAAVMTGQLQAGDLIVLGSDGLFDNVPIEDILLVVRAVSTGGEELVGRGEDGEGGNVGGMGSGPGSKAEAIATALGELAFSNSQDPEYESPYALEARRQGYELSFFEKLQAAKFTESGLQLGQITGGKMDDITVLVALVEDA